MARVVAQPFRFRLVGLWRERDRTADLKDHFRHGLAQQPDEVVILFEIDRTLPGRGIAHVDVQHGGAGVPAIHRRLHLLIPGNWNVGVAGQPLRAEWRYRDDQRSHVFRQYRVVGVVHLSSPVSMQSKFFRSSIASPLRAATKFPRQSGSGGGNAVESGCQTAKMLPSGSETTAYQAVFGTAVLGRNTLPPRRCRWATVSSSDSTWT